MRIKMLMQQTAEEHGLELNMEMPGAANTAVAAPAAEAGEDDLSKRLAALRN